MWKHLDLISYLAGISLYMTIAGMLAIPAYLCSKKKTIDIDDQGLRYFIDNELKVEFPLWKIFKIETKIRIRRYTSASLLIIWENDHQAILNLNDWELELDKMKEIFNILMNYSTEYKFNVEDKLKWGIGSNLGRKASVGPK
jgi:hypothetical protein